MLTSEYIQDIVKSIFDFSGMKQDEKITGRGPDTPDTPGRGHS